MTKPQRYGTSAAPRDDGIFCLYAEYERVVAECERLRAGQFSEADIHRALMTWFDPLHPDQNDFMTRMRKAIDAARAKD